MSIINYGFLMAYNVLPLAAVGDFGASAAADQPALNPPEADTKLDLTTSPAILPNGC